MQGTPASASHRSPGRKAGGSDLMVMQGLSKRFGTMQAVDGLGFAVRDGEILGVAGPNGAGKSTLIDICTGHTRPDAGSVVLGGKPLSGKSAHRFCHAGLARMFQIPQVFSSLSIGENVATGDIFGLGSRPPGTMSRDDILRLTGLAGQADRPAATADLITRKRIMLAAALATRPVILFMDEPLAGLNEAEIAEFADLIAAINAELGLATVLVEHKVRALGRLSDRIMILNFGRLVRIDVPEAILSDPEIIALYLGKSYAA